MNYFHQLSDCPTSFLPILLDTCWSVAWDIRADVRRTVIYTSAYLADLTSDAPLPWQIWLIASSIDCIVRSGFPIGCD